MVPPKDKPNWREEWLDYPTFCLLAARDDEVFATFRKTYVERGYAGIDFKSYHIQKAVSQTVEMLHRDYPSSGPLLAALPTVQTLDELGSTVRFDVPGLVGVRLSGLTMRYVKFAADMLQVFGPVLFPRLATGEALLPESLLKEEREARRPAPDIVEIGVGFGGQCAVITRLFEVNTYTLVDLPEVLRLVERVLREAGAPMEKIRFISAVPMGGPSALRFPSAPADLVISTFAYTEVTLPPRDVYFERVVRVARHGFMADNSGWTSGAYGGFTRGALPVQLLMAGKAVQHMLVVRENILNWNDDPNAALVIFGMEYEHVVKAPPKPLPSNHSAYVGAHYPIQKYKPCEWTHFGQLIQLCGGSTPSAVTLRRHMRAGAISSA